MKAAVMCMATSRRQAEVIAGQLQAAGFSNNDISVLLPDKRGTKDFAHERSTKAPEGAVAGAETGGTVGGALGLLAGLGALAIPGLGPLVAAGPLLATLSGVGAGAAVGGLAGGLIGMGIPEIEAKRYEGKVKGGNILLSVHTETSEARKRAESIFREANAHDICTAGEAKVPRGPDSPISSSAPPSTMHGRSS